MKVWEFFAAALGSLWANRMRSALTMIGIIIGTAAVISIFAVGQSASSSIGALLGTFGNQGIYLFADRSSRRFTQAQFQWRDAAVLRDQCTPCGKVFPFYDNYFTIRRGHRRDALEMQSDSDYSVGSLPLSEGRRFNHADVDGARAVALLWGPTKKKFLGDGPAVGKVLRVAGRPFTVVGVFADLSAGVLFGSAGVGDQIFIPYTTYHRIPNAAISGIQIYPADGFTAAKVIDESMAIVQRLHGPQTKYQAVDTTQQTGTFLKVIGYVGVAISAIGAIALVVGGIGVMNIMLVSVIERTREIGIRKAIGASRGDILLQFLTEAVAITLIGGIIGAALGGLAGQGASSFLIAKLSGQVGAINWLPILTTALGFSVAVGLFFGTYPAVRASRMAPIDCLRHE